MSESVIIALIALISPLLVGLAKELFSARKAKMDSENATLSTHEKSNEFLNKELQAFRTYHEQQMDAWRARYDKLQGEYYSEREKVIRLEFQLQLAREAREHEDLQGE